MAKQYAAPPEMVIDPENVYRATISTRQGDMVMELRTDLAPVAVNNFVVLADLVAEDDTWQLHLIGRDFAAATSPVLADYIRSFRERALELVDASAHPVTRDRGLVALNPLGQVPTLVTDEGAVLYDSRVIVEYLNALADGDLVPEDPDARSRRRARCGRASPARGRRRDTSGRTGT